MILQAPCHDGVVSYILTFNFLDPLYIPQTIETIMIS